MQGDREDRIRRRAHEIWEREGHPEGQHEAHWARASAEIDAEDQAGDTNVVKKVVRRTKKAAADVIGAGLNAVVDVVEEALTAKKPRARKTKTETAQPAAKTDAPAKAAKGTSEDRQLPVVETGSRAVAKTEDMAGTTAGKPVKGKAAKTPGKEPVAKQNGTKARRKSAGGQTQAVH